MAGVYFQALGDELIRSLGRPIGAVCVPNLFPELWTWEFQAKTWWVVYTIRKKGNLIARLVRKREIEIVILGLQDRAQTRDELEVLTRALHSRK